MIQQINDILIRLDPASRDGDSYWEVADLIDRQRFDNQESMFEQLREALVNLYEIEETDICFDTLEEASIDIDKLLEIL